MVAVKRRWYPPTPGRQVAGRWHHLLQVSRNGAGRRKTQAIQQQQAGRKPRQASSHPGRQKRHGRCRQCRNKQEQAGNDPPGRNPVQAGRPRQRIPNSRNRNENLVTVGRAGSSRICI